MRYREPEELAARRAFIAKLIEEVKPHILLIDGVQNWQFVPKGCKLPVVVDFCDCMTQLLTQQAKYESTFRSKMSIYLESYAVMHAELEALKGCDLAIAISPEDEIALRRIHKTAQTILVPNGINSRYFACNPEQPVTRDPNKIIFTGVMGYRPNEDAAIYFAENILPLIQEKHAEAEFWIVGARPTPAVKKLSKLKGVFVTGAVADIRPFLEESGVFVSPLRIGAGVKNKILSAWAMEIPVVATSISMAGLFGVHERHYIGANSDQEIADSICNVIQNPKVAKLLTREARTLVRERYTWSEPGTILEDRLIHLEAEFSS
jgi:glycosyltransferase involved in cell wall biosynthesis